MPLAKTGTRGWPHDPPRLGGLGPVRPAPCGNLVTPPSGDRPAAEGLSLGHAPASAVGSGHVAPAPRRVRALVNGEWLVDTRRASYVWEHPYYPQYYVPADDVRTHLILPGDERATTEQGLFAVADVRVGDDLRTGAARRLLRPTGGVPADSYRFDWDAIDHWFEEDEEIFVHPRSPYVRVDALRSTTAVRVEWAATVLAEASTCVIVFETGLPPRYYLDKTAIRWSRLTPADTVTQCPYKGTTTGYWRPTGSDGRGDIAWCYDFPTHQVAPIAGMVAFDDSRVSVVVDAQPTAG